MRSIYCRCLSTKLWPSMIQLRRLFWLFIVVVFCTWHTEGSNNSSQPCLCNSTTNNSDTSSLQNACNCTHKNLINCTKGYYKLNNTCKPCNCNSIFSSACNCTNKNQVLPVVCQVNSFLSNTSGKCENCSCNFETSFGYECKNMTGQCSCKSNVTGRQCNKCMVNYTAINSTMGRLLNCIQCPKYYATITKTTSPFYECVKQNLTVSTVLTEAVSSTIALSSVPAPSSMMPNINTPSKVLEPNSSGAPSSVMLTSIITASGVPILPSSTSILSTTILSTTIHSPTSTPPTKETSSTTSIPTISPVTTTQLPPSSSPVPPTTGVIPPLSTGTPTTKKPSTKQPTQETEPTSVTTSRHSTNDITSLHHEESSSGVVTIVLVSIGVFLVLVIAIAVGCWYLRSKRKPSAPFWTVELSNTRNEDIDFALLDPVTDERHSQSEEMQEMESFKPIGNPRYCAYI